MTGFEILALLVAAAFVVCWPLLVAAAAVSLVRDDLARLRSELATAALDDLADLGLVIAADVDRLRDRVTDLADELRLALDRGDDLADRVGDVELDDLALSMTATALEDTLAKMADLAGRVRDLEVGER